MGRRRLNCIWGYKKPVSAYVSHGHWTEKEENEREREERESEFMVSKCTVCQPPYL